MLQTGEYEEGSRRIPIRGDISKIAQLKGLGPIENMLLRNYHFISSRIAGTRQIRRKINHIVFSSRAIYGCPVFVTVTPSERHSGLAIRLMRYRRNDPAMREGTPEFAPYCGYDRPSMFPSTSDGNESASFDLPEYDVRRAMTGRDPLCAL